jgi:hypothetical protein
MFARDPELAADCRQRVRFVIEAEAQFDQALFELGQRAHRADDGAPPSRRQRLTVPWTAPIRLLLHSHG